MEAGADVAVAVEVLAAGWGLCREAAADPNPSRCGSSCVWRNDLVSRRKKQTTSPRRLNCPGVCDTDDSEPQLTAAPMQYSTLPVRTKSCAPDTADEDRV